MNNSNMLKIIHSQLKTMYLRQHFNTKSWFKS